MTQFSGYLTDEVVEDYSTHEIVTFPNAGHAFFNDTGGRYSPAAAAAAYQKLLGWFGDHLG